jgi:hypothetical protein
MSHQQRDRRFMHEIVSHPAEQPLTQAKMPVSAHDDEVSLSSLRFSHQPSSDVAAAALDAMKDGVDPVMPEMIDGIDTDDRLFLGGTLIGHDDDRNLICSIQKRHGLGQGSGRFPAAVPGDEDTIKGNLRPLRLGDQEQVPARSEQNRRM